MIVKHFLLLFLLIISLSNCGTVKKYVVKGSEHEVSNRIDSAFTKIGLNLEKEDNLRYYDGPLNRNIELEINPINTDSTLLIFNNPAFLSYYGENLMKVVHAELNNDFLKNMKPKSWKTQTILSLFLPAAGWYYMTDESIYWDSKGKSAFMAFVLFDAIAIDNILEEKESAGAWLTMMLTMRASIALWGNYFIAYDNKLIKAGYHIKF